jgi:hypothetical protein
MKLLNITLIAIFILFMVACEEDDARFSGPARIIIAGTGTATPGEVAEFTIGNVNNSESYTWTVEGPAQIMGNATGNTVSVEFTGVGDVTIEVSRGDDTGLTTVSVAEVEPAVTTRFNETGVLRSGETDTVFFDFAAPIASTPAFDMVTDEGFVSGSLGNLVRVDDDSYYAIYTAGEGDGTPQALFQDITATEAFGGVNIDSAFVNLYRVDNVAPVADLSYSETVVKEGSEVTVTATFNEPIMPQGSDKVVLITFTRFGAPAETDTLEATDDPLVYTVDYTVTANESGTEIEVGLPNAVDFARAPIADINNATITVDNADPRIITANAADTGEAVQISLTSSEDGTGWFIVLPDGADAPETTEDFSGGVASRMWDLSAATNRSTSIALAAGAYDVYFLVRDKAGNMSPIEMVNLTAD